MHLLLLIISSLLFIFVMLYTIYGKNNPIKSVIILITMIVILCFVLVSQRGFRNAHLENSLIQDKKIERKIDIFNDTYIVLKDSTLKNTFDYLKEY